MDPDRSGDRETEVRATGDGPGDGDASMPAGRDQPEGGLKILSRHAELGMAELADASRAPKTHTSQAPPEGKSPVLRVRKADGPRLTDVSPRIPVEQPHDEPATSRHDLSRQEHQALDEGPEAHAEHVTLLLAQSAGRTPDASSKSGQIRALLATDMSIADITKQVGCTPALVYNVKATAAGKKRVGATAKRGPRNSAATANMNGLAGILDAVKSGERERMHQRAALEKMQAVLADALA